MGPRLVSDETRFPLSLSGRGLVQGLSLELGPPVSRTVPLAVEDAAHAYARLPATLGLDDAAASVTVELRLRDGAGRPGRGTARLTIVHDAGFPELVALAAGPSGRRYAISRTTDELFAVGPEGLQRVPAGDGPTALAVFSEGGRERVAVAHRYEPALWIFDGERPSEPPRKLPAPDWVTGLAVADGVAYLAERRHHVAVALDLASGKERWRAPVEPNPGPVALAGDALAVGSRGTGELEIFSLADGARRLALAPGPGVSIVGGPTARFSKDVMGGKAPRALAWSPRLRRLFASSVGPNIGPNPERMEVSMNGGVAVIDPTGRVLRHLGFGAGTPEALALDDARGLLYVADVSLGLVRIVDARALAASDATAAHALLASVPLPIPTDFPLVRPAADFGVHGRAGPELHAGPRALALSADGSRLSVLCRFTGRLATLDVREARRGKAPVREDIELAPTLAERERRLGQILYFADLGRSGMSCEACHPEGGADGVLYSKTKPLRIYRSPSILGARDSAPYFNPPSSFTLEQTARFVGNRNRYHNPDLGPDEVRRLALYMATLAFPPNPLRGENGEPPAELLLPDGRRGAVAAGRELFFGKAACASCHPAPEYTTDENPATRGRLYDVGTPPTLPLRLEWQDRVKPDLGPPSLVGVWAEFPLLSSGTAGLGAKDGRLVSTTGFPLRAVLEHRGPLPHGNAAGLGAKEEDDLLAFLMTL